MMRRAVLAAALLLAPAGAAAAQGPVRRAAVGPPAFEGRADIIAGRSTTFQAGVAVLWPVSPFLRVGAVAAGGVTRGHLSADGREASARAEVVARFTPDPDPAARWRLYGQATAGVLAVRGATGRALVGLSLGVEHSPIGPLRPAVEVGIGGGLRVAIALRQRR